MRTWRHAVGARRRAEPGRCRLWISSAATMAPFPMAAAMTSESGESSMQKSAVVCYL